MIKIIKLCLYIFPVIFLSNCLNAHQYNFSLKNTLSIFILNDEKKYYFCIPVQYIGNYQINGFEFNNGNIVIGDYEILLKKDEINISVYLNEATDEYGNSDDNFNLIYLEENGKTLLSKMNEPISIKHESDNIMNHYYIFIERYLNNNEIKNIINEYEKGNINSRFYIGYDTVIENEYQKGNGMLDDFELYNGISIDPSFFPVNLNFFKTKYLLK